MGNGPELTRKAIFVWPQRPGVNLHFIQPRKPMRNAFVESFNGKYRGTCLNHHWFTDIDDAGRTIAVWKKHYNDGRLHSPLGYLLSSIYAQKAA